MKPRGPLMIEHRLIEKMIAIIKDKKSKMEKTERVDTDFIKTAIDFIKIYADATHHGKEEDILFRDCKKKNMSEKDEKLMSELITEHKYGRKIVGELSEAHKNYLKGEDTFSVIINKLKALINFYPQHIKKEDETFFPNSEKYFTEYEQKAMLQEFKEFDRKMIHRKYEQIVDKLKD